jgi:hypothetical protein
MCKALGSAGETKLQEVLGLYARLAHRLNRNREALQLYEELVTLVTKLKDGAPCAELGTSAQCIACSAGAASLVFPLTDWSVRGLHAAR